MDWKDVSLHDYANCTLVQSNVGQFFVSTPVHVLLCKSITFRVPKRWDWNSVFLIAVQNAAAQGLMEDT